MALKFHVHTEGLNNFKPMVDRACTKMERAVAMQAKQDTEPFVPMRDGSLRNRTRVVENRIIYPGPYARYLYYGKYMVNRKTGKGPAQYTDKFGNEVIKYPYGSKLIPTNRDLKFWHPGTRSHWFEASKAQNLQKWLRTAAKGIKDDI